MKELIKEQLDKKNLEDLKTVLSTKEGRRFFSWLLLECGRDVQDFKGNGRDIFLAGMRNVAMILVAVCKALDLAGVDLMHLAEREYIILQKQIAEDIRQKQKGGK